jgi:hypothetical protein
MATFKIMTDEVVLYRQQIVQKLLLVPTKKVNKH